MAAVTVAAPPLSPRVESVRVGSGVDTLYALQVSADAGLPTLRDQSTVRLSGSSGVITTHVARIVARRAFRLPLLPGSGNARARQWRYGWAYATAVTRGTRPALGYRGWVLLATTDSAARR